MTVVVVDDDDDMRELTSDILAAHGFTVHACATLEEVMALGPEGVDAVLTDLNLGPGRMQGGLELCRVLGDRHPAVRVYVFSGDSTAKESALRAGARGFWTKPVDMTAVAATLAQG